MFGIHVPKVYFVSKASTVVLPQPTVPFDVTQICNEVKTTVSPSYTMANFGTAWTLAVANNDADAQKMGLVNLTVTL